MQFSQSSVACGQPPGLSLPTVGPSPEISALFLLGPPQPGDTRATVPAARKSKAKAEPRSPAALKPEHTSSLALSKAPAGVSTG